MPDIQASQVWDNSTIIQEGKENQHNVDAEGK